jgi:hypothetical protein
MQKEVRDMMEAAVENKRLNSELQQVVSQMMQDRSEALEKACRDDLVKILEQMIRSGDIIRYTSMEAQKLVYIPYQRVMELENRVKELEEALKFMVYDIKGDILDDIDGYLEYVKENLED